MVQAIVTGALVGALISSGGGIIPRWEPHECHHFTLPYRNRVPVYRETRPEWKPANEPPPAGLRVRVVWETGRYQRIQRMESTGFYLGDGVWKVEKLNGTRTTRRVLSWA